MRNGGTKIRDFADDDGKRRRSRDRKRVDINASQIKEIRRRSGRSKGRGDAIGNSSSFIEFLFEFTVLSLKRVDLFLKGNESRFPRL